MATSKPQIVLVHGAWHVPEHYQSFIELLQNAGYTVHCPLLPTCHTPATSKFPEDVAAIRQLVSSLVDKNLQVVMLLHSYGGGVGTEAVQGLSQSDRQNEGKAGGVVHLIYMCAFLLQPGQSAGAASLPRPDPDPVDAKEDGTTFLCVEPKELFYEDVPEKQAEWASKLLVRHSLDALIAGVVSYPAWQHIPSTYLECTEDKVLFPYWQKEQLDAVKAAGTDIEVLTYKSSHSPFLSIPDRMVEAVNHVVAKSR